MKRDPLSSAKRWTMTVLFAVVIPLSLVAAMNFLVDAYGVFRDGTAAPSPNMSFVKVDYLLHHGRKFDSLLFGSSRAANLDIRKLSGSWYNLFYAAGLPEEHLQHLRFLIKNGIRLKNVLVSLDDFSYHFDPQDHLSDLDLQPYPGVSGKGKIPFYAEHLFQVNKLIPRFKAHLVRRAGNASAGNPFLFDLAGSGMVSCPSCDDTIEKNKQDHDRSDVFLKPWEYRFRETDQMEASLRALNELVLLSKQQGIRTILFINPIHKITYLNAHLEQFARFKERLAGISDYYDFSGLNAVTTDNYYYYETSHFRPLVGDMMLKVMLGEPDVRVPPGFGVHVTRMNVLSHLIEQCREVRDLGEGVSLTAENAAYALSCPGHLPAGALQAGR